MFRRTIRWIARPLLSRLRTWVDARVDARLASLEPRVDDRLRAPAPAPASLHRPFLFLPPCPAPWPPQSDFMAWSSCSAADFMHPRYAEICASYGQGAIFHRKAWEWAFVVHHLQRAGVLREGMRGLGFGVGKERLPALFARLGCEVVATDAPPEVGEASGWRETGQYSAALQDLRYLDVVDAATFDARVTHQVCDMNAIDPALRDFDFNWSSCCFEHLGSLQAGMDFVVNAVETTLKVGGVACHTTEFNLSSDDATVTEGETVIYRLQDMQRLVSRLRERGHTVQPFVVAPDSHYVDGFVDVPPYSHNPHLKLLLHGHVVTSAGLVITRGR